MSVINGKKTKSIYIALYTHKALRHGSHMQITPCLPFPRKRSPDGATSTEVAAVSYTHLTLPTNREV